MKAPTYRSALKKLDLTIASKATAAALGMGVRQCQRMAAGDTPIPGPVALLLEYYLKDTDQAKAFIEEVVERELAT
jgi:hypothetical protein